MEVAEQLRQRYGVNARVALRWSRGWTQQEAADQWSQRWPDDPKAARNFSYWETWPHTGHAPALPVLDRLAQLYQCDIADLVAHLPGYRHLDDATRRTAPTVTHVAPRLPATDLVVDPGRLAHAPVPAAIDIAAVQAMSDAFRTADRRCGGGVLYDSVVRYLNSELAPHLLGTTDQASDTQVYAAAASLTEAAGWMSHDSGNDTRARQHLTRAFKLATVADNHPLIANICASMAHLATQLGQPHEAVRLADKGIHHTGQRTDLTALKARLHTMRAHGLATRGEPRASIRAIHDAERTLDRHTEADPTVEWITHFDEGSLASETATCLRRLGDLTAAETTARLAIALRTGDRVRSRALALVTLAEVLTDADRIDEAAHIGLDLCTTAQTLASTRVVQRLGQLQRALDDHAGHPDVADFATTLTETQHQHRTSDTATSTWPT